MPSSAKTAKTTLRADSFSDLALKVLWLVYNGIISVVLIIALPALIPIVASTAKRRYTFRQRLGWWTYPWEDPYPQKPLQRGSTMWIHALSVGEVLAAQPLIQQLQAGQRFDRIVVTASTYTGYQTACRLFKDQDFCLAYFPYDWIWSVRTVSAKIDPAAVILIETDIWPNFLKEMRRRKIPIFLANVRLSDSAWRRYRRCPALARKVFGTFEKIGVQTQCDAHRLRHLGVAAEKVCLTGNIKFDDPEHGLNSETIDAWRKRLPIVAQRQVIVAGSTHEGEEAILLQALAPTMGRERSPLLIIAPRDPGRAARVRQLGADQDLTAVRLSAMTPDRLKRCPDLLVVDSLGVLKTLYALADVAFVGGSLVPRGGHNPLEPAACGKPILFGPDMRDFDQIATWLLAAGGARQVMDAEQLGAAVTQLLADTEIAHAMGDRALAVFHSHKGAVQRTLTCFGLTS